MRSISKIIEHDVAEDFFKVFIEWLKLEQKDLNTVSNILEKDKLLNHPSFRFINPEGESIKIDDIRNLKQELAFSNYNNEKRYFIFFNSDLATLQAQNASLKSIEEPPENTQIILLTPTIEKLIPTIISRCEVISFKKPSSQNKQKEYGDIADIYKKILDSKHYELIEISSDYKDRREALLFLNKLLSYLHLELNTNNSKYEKKKLAEHLRIILEKIKQLNQNVNVKLTIENCFFSLIVD